MTNTKTGTVYLIGAGPGDVKLMTVGGLDVIRRADVVVYDHLVNRGLLDEAKAGAEIIYVGKKNRRHSVEQEAINQLLVDKAREGKIVARLKGGDGFIFGRGGEEALFLAENGIPFEIVPGVSSAYAVPAYAGIPVTQRHVSSDVAFITGHEDPNKADSAVAWDKISTGVGTLVFLMGVKNLEWIVGNLVRHGRDPGTPIALIRWGTTADQETLTGTLADIVEQARRRQFKAPAVIVVGEVVKFRDKLAWFEKKPLFGQRILVTRSKDQAAKMVAAIEELGGEAVTFPTISVEPMSDYRRLDEAISRMSDGLAAGRPYYDWAIFTSVNGVDFFVRRLKDLGRDVRVLAGAKLVAIGPATAKALAAVNLQVDMIPDEYKAEGVLAALETQDLTGKRVLIPRAKEAREILPEQLTALGAEVTVAPTYQTVAATGPAEQIRQELLAGKINFVTFTSASTVRNFVRLTDTNGHVSKLLRRARVVAIGPITAETAAKLGVPVAAVAAEYTIPGVIKTVVALAHAEEKPGT